MTIRQIIRHIILSSIGEFSSPKPGVHILNGHMLCKKIPTIESANHFRQQLKSLNKHCKFINFEDAVKLIVSGQCYNVNVPYIAFSFDDGFDEDYLYLAPILEEFNVNAAFFINPNYVEGDDEYIKNFNNNIVKTPNKRPMRWSQIIDLHKRGHIIGAHTLDHYMIASNDTKELQHQILKCREAIEQKLNCPCEYFAFPYGKLEHANQKAIDIASTAYKYIFSQSDYKHYYSFNRYVINRRHFEPFWPINHVMFFLRCKKS